MKTVKIMLAAVAVCFFVVAASFAKADMAGNSAEDSDKTLSPYFYVESGEGGVLPLKDTWAKVNIAGTIAAVEVTQVYHNTGKVPLEAVYVFPASTRAAVHAMTMTIKDRVIRAKIKEKEEARATYEKAKDEGKTASLLEEHRPNVFEMRVANIMPGDEIKVVFSYTEYLEPVDGAYEFVYPGVVGPRYVNEKTPNTRENEWLNTPHQKEGEKALYGYSVETNIFSGIPIKEVRVMSHKAKVEFKDKYSASVRLDKSEDNPGNRDYILGYRLEGETIESGMLTYEGEKENFFLVTVEPPARVAPFEIPAREYIYIVDVSGSMSGFPLDTAKKLMRDLLGSLRPEDKFNVILFAGGSEVFSPESVDASAANIKSAVKFVDNQHGGGGTEILPALKRGFALKKAPGVSRSVIIVTDGYVSVEAEAFDLIRKSLGSANVFAFGIGSSVNRHLIEGMARAGQGEPFVVTDPGGVEEAVGKFGSYVLTPVLTDVRFFFEGFDAYDVTPVSSPDVLAKRPVSIFGKYRGKAAGTVVLKGSTPGGRYEKRIDVSKAKTGSGNGALKYLWARNRIAELSDYDSLGYNGRKNEKDAITKLGIEYNLLTKYTSFVAVDEVVRNFSGSNKTVNQPLPMPKGVSNAAIGGTSVPTVPEPETYALVIVASFVIVWTALRLRRRDA